MLIGDLTLRGVGLLWAVLFTAVGLIAGAVVAGLLVYVAIRVAGGLGLLGLAGLGIIAAIWWRDNT